MPIEVYTDGSCHTQQRFGAWAAIILNGTEKTMLSGTEKNTTHNRMELMAVINALKTIKESLSVVVISDSQYVVGLATRKERLLNQGFTTNSGKEIRNADLVKELLALNNSVSFIKVRAHQKKTVAVNYNIEADVLVRKLMRKNIS